MLNSQGLIPMMPPDRALKSIQYMAHHSQNWYDRATTWQRSCHDLDSIVVIIDRLDSLGCDMQKLEESIHAIQETINKYWEELNKKQAANEEWMRKFKENTNLYLKMLDAAIKNLEVKVEKLTHEILKNEDDADYWSCHFTQEDLKLKISEEACPPELIILYVKKSVGVSSGAQNLAFMTAPSTSSTNDVNTTNPAYEVSTVSPNINTDCPQVSTANFSDNTVYAFMVEN
ncbi:hypothetical protein Tco_1155723 [Tanacetum coccineum]